MISFISQPNTIEPVYSNLVFQFESTGATDPTKFKYRYVVDVFASEVNEGQTGQLAQLKITPSQEGWGQVDISPILRNYTHSKPVNKGCTGSTEPLHTSKWGYLDDNMLVYSIKVGEEYSDTDNGVITSYNGKGDVGNPDFRSNVCYAYNGVKEWFNGKNYNFTPFHLTGGTTFNSGVSRYLTNSPRSRWIREGDYATLAALNYMDITTSINTRQVYSALFTFYDDNNNVLSSGRTYNIYDNCGTRPNCEYYDGFWETPSNWAEQQVIYLGVGTPNIAEHGINIPANTQYYKVELEGTLQQPTPPAPQIDTFDGCSCHQYEIYNPSVFDVSVGYLDCTGSTQTFVSRANSYSQFCACQNSLFFSEGGRDLEITDQGVCDACVCKTYRVFNPDPDFPNIASYISCSGTSENVSIPPDDFVDICACEGSISGLPSSLRGECPIPFSANCKNMAVYLDPSIQYPFPITYTGCCGNLITQVFQPNVSTLIVANDPFPTSSFWGNVVFGSASVECPPDPIPPQPTTISSGDHIICRNLCDNSLMYFTYNGDTINLGNFINYENTAYEIIAVGGGGFIELNNPYVFLTEASALSAFPCPAITGTTNCLDTIVISEPFIFYLDGKCSQGDRLVYFMNKYGTWDSYNFRAKEDKGFGIQKEEYKTSPELYNQGWDTDSYYGWNSRRKVWSQLVSKSGVLYTDFMPQSEMLWLSEELFESPSVYLVGDDGILEPITITNTEVVVPNYQVPSNKYQINIEYKSGYDTIRQNHE